LFNNELSILSDQSLELLIVGGVLGHRFNLITRHIATDGLSVLTPLQIVIRPVGALAHDAELTGLHVLNLSDSVEELSAVRMLHGRRICIYIYLCYKKGAWKVIFLNSVLRPPRRCRVAAKVAGKAL
jgi:hypothetical protein